MNLVEDKIVHLLTGKPSLSEVTVDELLAITDKQPFFSVAQLLLTQKMKQVNHPGFTHQLQKTALFFPNTFWLDQHLQEQPDSRPASSGSSYNPQPAVSDSSSSYQPSYTPSAYTPSSYEPAPAPSSTPVAASTPPATEEPAKPWYMDPAYMSTLNTSTTSTPELSPKPTEPATPSWDNSAYMPPMSSTPAPAEPYKTEEPSYNKVEEPKSSWDNSAYMPPMSSTPAPAEPYKTEEPYKSEVPKSSWDINSAYMPSMDSTPAPAPAETPKTEDAAKPWYMDTAYQQPYAPSAQPEQPSSSFAPEPPKTEEPAKQPWYMDPIYQQPYAPATEASTPAETTAAETPATTEPVKPWYTDPVYQQSSEIPAPEAATPAPTEEAAKQPWYMDPIYQQPYQSPTQAEEPAAIEAVPAIPSYTEPALPEVPLDTEAAQPAEPVAAEEAAKQPWYLDPVYQQPAEASALQAEVSETTPTEDQPVQTQTAAEMAAAPLVAPPVSSGPYRLVLPPVITVGEDQPTDNTPASTVSEPMSIVEIAEAAATPGDTEQAPVHEPSALEQSVKASITNVIATIIEDDEPLPPLDDNTDAPPEATTEDHTRSSIPNMRIAEMLQTQAASFNKPVEASAKLPFGLEPYMIDYFASQGIHLEELLNEVNDDGLTRKVRKFTDWLKQMRRISPHPSDLGTDSEQEQAVQGIAALSIEAKEILTESMAEVLVKQGKIDKAIQLYSKLSFLNPAKTAYFASKIIETSKLGAKGNRPSA